MEWSKVKNVIILILLIVNGFLLALVANQEWQSAQYQQEARSGALQALESGGIHMEEDALPKESRLRTMTAERDREAEKAMAEALLGTAREGEKIGSYTGERGEGSFLSNGSFTITFREGAYPVAGEELEREVPALLKRAGMECTVTGRTEKDGTVRLAVRQVWEGTPLFNCQAVVVWKDGALTGIEGQQRLVGVPVESGTEKPLNVATVLLRFLAGVRSGGFVCSEIKELTSGYETSVSPSGTAKLSPVWQVVTDGLTFYVDGITGSVRQAG